MLLIDGGVETGHNVCADEQVLHISSCCDEMDRAVEFVRCAIGRAGVSKDDEVDFLVAFSEALTNAIFHGNGEDVSKQVHIRVLTTSVQITVCVQDEGDGFDLSTLPDPRTPENVMKPSGRGVYMMQMFMNDVRFDQTEEGMMVTMTKRISSSANVDFTQVDGSVNQHAEGIWWAGCCDPRLTQKTSIALGKEGPFSVAWSVAFDALCRLVLWFECKLQGVEDLKITRWRKCE